MLPPSLFHSLPTARRLLTEVKRLDDKLLLVDVHLLESKGMWLLSVKSTTHHIYLESAYSLFDAALILIIPGT